MSLKSFHLFFIVVSILAAFGFAYWSFDNYRAAPEPTFLVLSIVSALVGVGLVGYGIVFVRKAKQLIE